jgi:hypothetical protein
MWFKRTYSLPSMHLQRPDQAPVHFADCAGTGRELLLWVKPPEKQPGQSQLCCDALLERNLGPDLQGMFELIGKRILPQDAPPVVTLPHKLSFDAVIDSEGRIPEKWAIPVEIMPRKFQTLERDISRELSDLARRFIKTIRWMQRASGRQSPLALVSFQWAADKTDWHPMPFGIRARTSFQQGMDLGGDALAELHAVWSKGQHEPLAHELLREALDIAHSNPRSALLIGVSAVETGLKQYIQQKVPNSDVILEKLPSPPAFTMVQEVIPALHKLLEQKHDNSPLPKNEADFFRKWVTQRNQIAHGIKSSVDVDDLLEFLEFSRRLLYRLDAYSGHQWAALFAAEENQNVGIKLI